MMTQHDRVNLIAKYFMGWEGIDEYGRWIASYLPVASYDWNPYCEEYHCAMLREKLAERFGDDLSIHPFQGGWICDPCYPIGGLGSDYWASGSGPDGSGYRKAVSDCAYAVACALECGELE